MSSNNRSHNRFRHRSRSRSPDRSTRDGDRRRSDEGEGSSFRRRRPSSPYRDRGHETLRERRGSWKEENRSREGRSKEGRSRDDGWSRDEGRSKEDGWSREESRSRRQGSDRIRKGSDTDNNRVKDNTRTDNRDRENINNRARDNDDRGINNGRGYDDGRGYDSGNRDRRNSRGDERSRQIIINPTEVPKGNRYFTHDDRELGSGGGKRVGGGWSSSIRTKTITPRKWGHDMFDKMADEGEETEESNEPSAKGSITSRSAKKWGHDMYDPYHATFVSSDDQQQTDPLDQPPEGFQELVFEAETEQV